MQEYSGKANKKKIAKAKRKQKLKARHKESAKEEQKSDKITKRKHLFVKNKNMSCVEGIE